MLGVAAGLFGRGARLLGHALRTVRALTAKVGEYRCAERRGRQHGAGARNLPRPRGRAPRRQFARSLLSEQPLGGCARLALVALIATGRDDTAQHVVGELDSADVETLLDTQQASVDEQRERARCGAGLRKTAQQALF